MCEKTDRIIFCTCPLAEDLPDEYWMLHRLVDGKDEFILGSLRMPVEISVVYEDMEMELCWRLNEAEYFDKPMSFERMDVLIIRLDGFEKYFAFEFNGRDWKPARDKDSFELMSVYN